jgi:predicted GNAT family acetyltransferase
MFGKPKPAQQLVTDGRFEMEQDGKIAYLEYTLGGGVIVLSHTEIPAELRGHGMSAKLAKGALDWARENNVRVDVVCDSVAAYIKEHPEYQDLVLR